MDANVVKTNGKKSKTASFADGVFARDVSEGAIYHAIRNELANMRVGTAQTRTRGEVQYSGRKPWRQKGTGRARSGSKRSPVWVGGGTTFGPQMRDYSYRMPRKMKRVALHSILSLKASAGDVIFVEDFSVDSGKTKDMASLLRGLTDAAKVVLITSGDDPMLKRASRNIPWLRYLNWNRLRAHDLYYAKKLVIMEGAALQLGSIDGGGTDET